MNKIRREARLKPRPQPLPEGEGSNRARLGVVLLVLLLIMNACAPTYYAGSDGVRAVQVDLDYVYDDDAAQMDRNIDALVTRMRDMRITTVFLQAFADPTGTGLASAVYFPSQILPMRADIFGRVAAQLHEQAGVAVYGWLPVLSFDLGDRVTPVMAWDAQTNAVAPADHAYHRASLFDLRARRLIGQLFAEMAAHGAIQGILFHDDAMLSDYEDASPPALKAYQRAGLPDTIAALRNPTVIDQWTAFKTQALIDFTHELTNHARRVRSPLATVRNIYALPVLNPHSEEWFAQNYRAFLDAYDFTAIEAMPAMENVPDDEAETWFANLVKAARDMRPDALRHTIFELQSVDWRKAKAHEDRAIPPDVLCDQIGYLLRHGAVNIGYYPDDFKANTPDFDRLRESFSVEGSSAAR